VIDGDVTAVVTVAIVRAVAEAASNRPAGSALPALVYSPAPPFSVSGKQSDLKADPLLRQSALQASAKKVLSGEARPGDIPRELLPEGGRSCVLQPVCSSDHQCSRPLCSHRTVQVPAF
jgi:hypothetical protein